MDLSAIMAQYGLDLAQAVFLRHNENRTYRVRDTAGRAYALRVHQAAPGIDPKLVQHHPQALQAHLAFMEALRAGGVAALQRPCRTLTGGLIAKAQADGQAAPATLLTWVAGEPLQEAQHLPRLADALGRLTARMHVFSASWPQGKTLALWRYDAARVKSAVTGIRRGVDSGRVTPGQMDCIEAAGEEMLRCMAALDRMGGQFGVIHADLSFSNLLVQGEEIIPIDFSLAGHGYFAQDVGSLLAFIDGAEAREKFLAGYRSVRPLPQEDMHAVEGFFLLGIFLFMALHIDNPDVEEWFYRRLPDVCRRYARPFLKGEPFYQNI